MGGFGSGKWMDVMTRKVTTGLCRTLSVKQLKQMGVFDEDRVNEVFCIQWVNECGDDAGMVKITPRVSGHGNKRSLRVEIGAGGVAGDGFVTVTTQDIPITTTPCYYGGVRYWFLCPAVVDGLLCENRVGKLYLPPGGKVFACRHCYGLTYESCQKSHKYDRIIDHIPDDLDLEGLNLTQVLRLASL